MKTEHKQLATNPLVFMIWRNARDHGTNQQKGESILSKFISATTTAIAYLLLLFASNVKATEFELTPNPNPSQNVISVTSGNVGINSADPFTNFGGIYVQAGGMLRNVGQMDITIIEGRSNLAYVAIDEGAVLDARARSKMNFDSVSTFSVFGTVNNLGSISSDWLVTLGETSQFNNGVSGVFNNKKAGYYRGIFVNSGSVINSTPGSGTGGYIEQHGDFQNRTGGSFVNQGVVSNFGIIANRGTISNEVYFNTGVGRGEFTSENSGTINNESGGPLPIANAGSTRATSTTPVRSRTNRVASA